MFPLALSLVRYVQAAASDIRYAKETRTLAARGSRGYGIRCLATSTAVVAMVAPAHQGVVTSVSQPGDEQGPWPREPRRRLRSHLRLLLGSGEWRIFASASVTEPLFPCVGVVGPLPRFDAPEGRLGG